VPDNDPSPRPNFAYRVPRNVYAPRAGEWSTLVRPDRIRAGDVLDDLSWAEEIGELVTVRGSPDKWEVIAIEPTGDKGRRAVLHRKLAPDAIWDGALVVRLVR